MNKEKVMDSRKISRFAEGMSTGFLLIHSIMLLIFNNHGVKPMVYVSIFGILFFGASYLLIRKGLLWQYVMAVYAETVLFMTLAAWFVGAESGFQITLIGLTVALFYTDYLSNIQGHRRIPALWLSVSGMVLFFVVYIHGQLFTAPYAFPAKLSLRMQTMWGVITFAVTLLYMKLFAILASQSDNLLSDQAMHDPLTGLYNRAGYEQLLASQDIGSTTLLLVDADCFKGINDSFGHEAGDRVLKKIADSLWSNFRSGDYVCRIGGDEFAVIMRGQNTLRIELITSRIKDVNDALADTSDGVPRISVSAGAAYGGDAESVESLFEHADAALYQRKEEGRRGCSFYQPQEKQS